MAVGQVLTGTSLLGRLAERGTDVRRHHLDAARLGWSQAGRCWEAFWR